MTLTEFMHLPIVAGAVSGILGAAAADFAAFRSWKNVHDAASYDWQTAAWRWFQGAVIGAAGGAGLGALTG